jgi:hypothetical protein
MRLRPLSILSSSRLRLHRSLPSVLMIRSPQAAPCRSLPLPRLTCSTARAPLRAKAAPRASCKTGRRTTFAPRGCPGSSRTRTSNHSRPPPTTQRTRARLHLGVPRASRLIAPRSVTSSPCRTARRSARVPWSDTWDSSLTRATRTRAAEKRSTARRTDRATTTFTWTCSANRRARSLPAGASLSRSARTSGRPIGSGTVSGKSGRTRCG